MLIKFTIHILLFEFRLKANLCFGSQCRTEVKLVFSELKKGIENASLSHMALGVAIRRAFPSVVRRKIGAVHYYCGVEFCLHPYKADTSTNDVKAAHLLRKKTSSKCLPHKEGGKTSTKEVRKMSNKPLQQHNGHHVTSININLKELKATVDDPLLGEVPCQISLRLPYIWFIQVEPFFSCFPVFQMTKQKLTI